MLALRPVLVHCKFPVCLYNVCNAITNALHTRQAYSSFVTLDLLLFAELPRILQPDCTAMFRRSLYLLSPCTCVGSCFHLSCDDKPNRLTNEEETRKTTQKVSTENMQVIKNKTPTNKRCNFHRKRHCTCSHSDAGNISPVTHSLSLTQHRNKTIYGVCPVHES
jgi:hypothetical protein